MNNLYDKRSPASQKLIDFVVSKSSKAEMNEARKAVDALVRGHYYDFEKSPRATAIAKLFVSDNVSSRVYLLEVTKGPIWITPEICGQGVTHEDAQRDMVARGYSVDQRHDAYLVFSDRTDLTSKEVDAWGFHVGEFGTAVSEAA